MLRVALFAVGSIFLASPAASEAPLEWRGLASQSMAVVRARPNGLSLVERPELRTLRHFRDSSGNERVRHRSGEAVVGKLFMFEVTEVWKSDRHVSVGQTISVFAERSGGGDIAVFRPEREYVLFLIRPFRVNGGPDLLTGWMSLNGGVAIKYTQAGTVEVPFNPAQAYGFALVAMHSPAEAAIDASDPRINEIRHEVELSQHVLRPQVSVAATGSCEGPTCTLAFQATAADPEGDPVTFEWEGCASGTGSTLSCTVNESGDVVADVTVRDPAGVANGKASSIPVFAVAHEVEPWGECTSVQDWTCTEAGPQGCTRRGQKSRAVRETALTLKAADAATRPDTIAECTLSTEGFVNSYSATYEAQWTCTRSGESGCYKHRLNYSIATYGPVNTNPQIPPETIYSQGHAAQYSVEAWSTCSGSGEYACTGATPTGCSRPGTQTRSVTEAAWTADAGAAVPLPPSSQTCTQTVQGYVAAYYVGPWGSCSASCGGGIQYRTVNPSSWKAIAPSAPSPADSQACNTHSCELTCYDYPDAYETWGECYAVGYPVCETRYRSNGVGGWLTCRVGFW